MPHLPLAFPFLDRGRRGPIAVTPTLLTAGDEELGPGRIVLRVRERFLTLPTAGLTPTPGQKILGANSRRRGVALVNNGSGTVYINTSPNVSSAHVPIPAGSSLNLDQTLFPPQNALWAVGEVGHDLRIYELIEE